MPQTAPAPASRLLSLSAGKVPTDPRACPRDGERTPHHLRSERPPNPRSSCRRLTTRCHPRSVRLRAGRERPRGTTSPRYLLGLRQVDDADFHIEQDGELIFRVATPNLRHAPRARRRFRRAGRGRRRLGAQSVLISPPRRTVEKVGKRSHRGSPPGRLGRGLTLSFLAAELFQMFIDYVAVGRAAPASRTPQSGSLGRFA
jgi:hypothetical protein